MTEYISKKPRALIGLHDEISREVTEEILQNQGYEVVVAEDLSEMVRNIEVPFVSKEFKYKSHFELYVMDANLGRVGQVDDAPAMRVHQMILPQVERGDAEFVTVTGNPALVSYMHQRGITAIPKTQISSYFGNMNRKYK